MRKILSSVLALLMLISVFSCLTVTGFAADELLTEKENNDTAATANEIIVGETNIGALQTIQDLDWYKFTSDKDVFSIKFDLVDISNKDYMTYGWNVTIYDEDLSFIDSYNSVTSFESIDYPINGTIYVKIQTNYTNSYYCDTTNVEYTLVANTVTNELWETEYNNVAAVANNINVGKTNIAALQSIGDVDWFKFESDKDYFTIDFDLVNISYRDYISYGWNVSLYDANLNFIQSYNNTSKINSTVIPFTGTIYIKVETNYTNQYYCDTTNVYYNFTIKTFENAQWETERNNTSTTANKIEQGKSYKGLLHYGEDVDFFKFKATSDAFKIKFFIDLSETSVDRINEGWKMTIYPSDSASSIVGNYTVSSIGSFETRILPYEKGKEYFVRIEAADTYSTRAPIKAIYNFEVIDATDGKNWEKENGQNAFEYATPVNSGEVVYGNLYSSSDYDHYKISVPTDGLVNFTFTREEDYRIGDGWKFYLKNAAGTTVFTGEVKDIITGKSLNIDVKKGNYYLIVTSKNSNAPASDIDYSVVINYAMYTPKITKIANASNGITVNWNKTAGVSSYILYRREYNASTKKWSGWKAIAKPSASTTSYVDKTAKSGVSYRYTLKGVYGNLASSYVSTATLLCLAQPKTTVKAVSNGINVSWTQSAGATGYTVYRMEYNAKTKKWSGWKNMGTAKATKKSWTDKSAKKGVTYKYTVKAVNGKTASSYKSSSSVKR